MFPQVKARFRWVCGLFTLCAACLAWNAPGGAETPASGTADLSYAMASFQDARPEDRSPWDDAWDDEEADETASKRDVAYLRRLTSEEIQRVRFLELRALRLTTDRPDRVSVKIPKKTVDDFLLEMEGHEDFLGEPSRREFRRLTPAQKLHFIALYQGEAFVDKLEITSDPEIFLEFRRNVQPIVLRGCANTGCHSPNYRDEVRFGLFKDPKRLPATTYANFIMLNELTLEGRPLINRAQPENSLLLTYMLPDREVRPALRHPGNVKLRPIFQTRSAPGYRRIERWIGSLRQPMPNYGISFFEHDPAALRPEDDEDLYEEP